MTPYYSDPWLDVYQGDCREVMRSLEPESVHCVVTSPPYWGLRDYGTANWEGGDEGCDHQRQSTASRASSGLGVKNGKGPYGEQFAATQGGTIAYGATCGKCGARRQDSQLGLEPTPEEYVANLVAVFREVRRVLRNDGTVWLNLGDSYASSPPGNLDYAASMAKSSGLAGAKSPKYQATLTAGHATKRNTVVGSLKPKDLVGIPWRVAFALQADGWYLRSDIIWAKPNPMPESVTDRPTKSHEYLFLLSKSPRYYFDADAVREPALPSSIARYAYADGDTTRINKGGAYREKWDEKDPRIGVPTVPDDPAARNLRSVWNIATQPYPGAHFATFPRKLVEPCVKAGTSERGVCPHCEAPWTRVARERPDDPPGGWLPAAGCILIGHAKDNPIPATVLDPFAGSGTTGVVAQSLNRRAILIDLNGDYLVQAMQRNRDIPLGLGAA